MKIKTLYDILDSKFPKDLSCEWDNDGIMCIPNEENEVKKVLVCLDVTEKAIHYAKKNSCDAIVSHHPLVFKPLRGIDSRNNVCKKLIKLIRSNISVLSFHTRLDTAKGGVNDALVEKIGLHDVKTFGCGDIQMGRIGILREETQFNDFIAFLKEEFCCPFITAVRARKNVYNVAVLGGEGKDFYHAARAAGADTFITGDAGYNFLLDASEYPVNVICLGHFTSEDSVCQKLIEIIKDIDPAIETEYFHSNSVETY